MKHSEPFLALPPAAMPLVGWRDPYIFEYKDRDGFKEWGMLLGSGIKGRGGAIMIYRSPDLHGGKQFVMYLMPRLFRKGLESLTGNIELPWWFADIARHMGPDVQT